MTEFATTEELLTTAPTGDARPARRVASLYREFHTVCGSGHGADMEWMSGCGYTLDDAIRECVLMQREMWDTMEEEVAEGRRKGREADRGAWPGEWNDLCVYEGRRVLAVIQAGPDGEAIVTRFDQSPEGGGA